MSYDTVSHSTLHKQPRFHILLSFECAQDTPALPSSLRSPGIPSPPSIFCIPSRTRPAPFLFLSAPSPSLDIPSHSGQLPHFSRKGWDVEGGCWREWQGEGGKLEGRCSPPLSSFPPLLPALQHLLSRPSLPPVPLPPLHHPPSTSLPFSLAPHFLSSPLQPASSQELFTISNCFVRKIFNADQCLPCLQAKGILKNTHVMRKLQDVYNHLVSLEEKTPWAQACAASLRDVTVLLQA